MQWKSFKDELPEVGKRVVLTRPGSDTLAISRLMYTLLHDEDRERGYGFGVTEDMIKCTGGYWLEIPEPPIKGE